MTLKRKPKALSDPTLHTLLVDTLNEHYATFYMDMGESYGELQAFSYEELKALKKIKKQRLIGTLVGVALMAGSVAAGC